MDGLELIHEASLEEPFFVVDKPSGLPSAPLRDGDDSALTRMLARFPEIACVQGRKAVECGLVHRLDTLTSGLLLIAASQDFYDRIIEEQEAGRFVKSYDADCDVCFQESPTEGFPSRPLPNDFPKLPVSGMSVPFLYELSVRSRFRSWGPHGREVRPVTEESGLASRRKASPCIYQTNMKLSFQENGGCKAVCRIRRGYRHQVRCHLAWIGFPVKGDTLYNSPVRGEGSFCFRATGLEFLGLSFRLN